MSGAASGRDQRPEAERHAQRLEFGDERVVEGDAVGQPLGPPQVLDLARHMDAFDAALKQDKMRSNTLKISELGLVEMTRKRTRENISRILGESCP